MRLTVGPLPSAVYWRRRAVVLGALLLVLFLLAQACMAASASSPDRSAIDPQPTGSATPLPPESPEPTPGGSAAPAGADDSTGDDEPDNGSSDHPDDPLSGDRCSDSELRVLAEAEQTEAAVGASIKFLIRIQHNAGRTCQRDVGAGQRELYLRKGSGAARVWSSRDCAELTGRDVQEVAAGFEVTAWVVWNGQASDACDSLEQPTGGPLEPGEYQLVARLGTAYSAPVTITLTAAS